MIETKSFNNSNLPEWAINEYLEGFKEDDDAIIV